MTASPNHTSSHEAQGATTSDRIAHWRGKGWDQLTLLMTPDAAGYAAADRLCAVTVSVRVVR